MSHLSPAAFLRPVLFLGLLVLLCHAPAAHAHRCELRAMRAHVSLRMEDLESWEPLDTRTVLVWAQDARRAHLLHLSRRVTALIDSPILTLVDGDHDGTITACGRDGVMVQGSTRVRIRSIEYLSEKRTVELDRARTWPVPLQVHEPRRGRAQPS